MAGGREGGREGGTDLGPRQDEAVDALGTFQMHAGISEGPK
jgi:hypothetical protein